MPQWLKDKYASAKERAVAFNLSQGIAYQWRGRARAVANAAEEAGAEQP